MAKYDTNGRGKFINAQGKVVKNRSGFEPMTREAIEARIARGEARIRSINSAIRDMRAILAGPAVVETPALDPARVAAAVNDAVARVLQAA